MRNYAENGELCGIVRRSGNCAISHSPHLNVASGYDPQNFLPAAGIYSVIKLVIHNGLNYQIGSR